MKALVPEDLPRIRAANDAANRRSVTRCISAIALAALHKKSAEMICNEAWPTDATAALLTRAAVMPNMTTDAGAPLLTAVQILPSVAPQAASVRLFSQAGFQLDFAGVHQYSLPHLGSMPEPIFVGEGGAIPVVNADLDATVVGPTKKLAFIVPLSGELETYSIQAASEIFRGLMADAAGRALDLAVFSATAGDAIRTAGLLNGVTPVTATAGGGTSALIGDLKKLIGGIADSGINTASAILVVNPEQRESLSVLAPQYPRPILETAALAVGSVVAIAPDAVATGYDGSAEIRTSKNAAVHFEDTTPLQIGTAGTPGTVAVTTMSAFQADLQLLKLIMRCAWAVRPGAVQYTTGATW